MKYFKNMIKIIMVLALSTNLQANDEHLSFPQLTEISELAKTLLVEENYSEAFINFKIVEEGLQSVS